MSRPGPVRTPFRGGEWVLVFRIFVLFPALLTIAALGASSLWSGDDPPPASLMLAPAAGSTVLPEPSFGPPLVGVFSAGDAAESPGGWVVLDRRGQQLVLLDGGANLVALTGREGEGPGELERATAVAVADTTIVVVDGAARALELFGLDGAFRSRVALRPAAGCPAASVRELIGEPTGVAMLTLCTRTDGGAAALVERISLSGEREVVLDQVYQDAASGYLDPMRSPLLARVGGKLHFAIMGDPCVRVLEAEPGTDEWVCHPDANPVLLPDSVRAQFDEIGARARSIGRTLIVPDRLPPFDGLASVGGRLAFHVVLSDRSHAYERVRGAALERLELPDGVLVSPGSRSLLIARDHPEGTAFAVLPVP